MPGPYNPLVPTGTVDLDVDYQNLQNNFQELDTIFGIDHTLFSNNTAQKGYHEVIHLIPDSTVATNPPNNQPIIPPTAVAGIGEIFTAQINDGIATDEALFYQSGGNRLSQLTRNFAPTTTAAIGGDIRTFLPGGLILICSSFNPNVSINVTFPFGGFPSVCSSLQLTGSAATNVSFRNNLKSGTLTPTGFTWEGSVGTAFTPIFYWAIGY